MAKEQLNFYLSPGGSACLFKQTQLNKDGSPSSKRLPDKIGVEFVFLDASQIAYFRSVLRSLEEDN